jgi:hypothetical protein
MTTLLRMLKLKDTPTTRQTLAGFSAIVPNITLTPEVCDFIGNQLLIACLQVSLFSVKLNPGET